MHLVHVLPIANIHFPHINNHFTYFTSIPIEIGALVEISINNRLYTAIVIKRESTTTAKLKIKTGTYKLKKIRRVIAPPGIISTHLLHLSHITSDFYRVSQGRVLKLFIPAALLKSQYTQEQTLIEKNSDLKSEESEGDVVIGSQKERVQHYKTIIRQSLAQGRGISIFSPTVHGVEYLGQQLSDLPRKPVLIHGSLGTNRVRVAYRLFRENTSACCLITTPLGLGVLKGNEHIIIDDADSPHYNRSEAPSIHYTRAILWYAKIMRSPCTRGKYFPSLVDIKNETKLQYLSSRIKSVQQFSITETPSLASTLFSNTTREILDNNVPTIIFVSRKGYFTFITCLQCNAALTCTACGAFLVHHAHDNTHYQCHKCFRRYEAALACNRCGGWDLKGYGIGTERVSEQLGKYFRGRPLWILDETHQKTARDRARTIDQFLRSSNGILVGTEMILEEPALCADAVIVLSLDNLFSIPDISLNERILSILFKLRERSLYEPVLIQTRFPAHPLFRYLMQQNIKNYLITELEERKRESLPPYTLAIKIEISEKNDRERKKQIEEIQAHLAPYVAHITSYPSLAESQTHNILLLVDESRWQTNLNELKNALDRYAKQYTVVVDPESIL